MQLGTRWSGKATRVATVAVEILVAFGNQLQPLWSGKSGQAPSSAMHLAWCSNVTGVWNREKGAVDSRRAAVFPCGLTRLACGWKYTFRAVLLYSMECS